MKILFLIRQLNYGGAERQLVTLANELAHRGHEVGIAAYYGGGALAREVDCERVRLLDLKKRSRWDLLFFFWRFVQVVRREQPTVLYSWNRTPNLVATMAHFLCPDVRLFWCVRHSDLKMFNDKVQSLADWLESRLSRFADCIVVNSRVGFGCCLSRGFPREKLVHIPNGIDVNHFYPDAAGGRRVRAEWGFTQSQKLIGLVSRLDPIKNHTVFLSAAAQLEKVEPEARFVCIGHGPVDYQQKLEAISRELGLEQRVLWVPGRSDMRDVYNALDVCCLPSLSEGFPNVVGEAMACGRHCVVTDVGDTRFLVGDTGVIVAPKDADGLAEGLRRQLAASNNSNGRGRQRILENFTVAHLADRTEEALRGFSTDLLHCKASCVTQASSRSR